MKRYFLSKIVVVPGPGGADMVTTAVVANYHARPNTTTNTVMPENPVPGDWAMTIIDSPNLADALADQANNEAMPDLSADATLGALNANTRQRMLNRLAAIGIDMSNISTSTSYRDTIRQIGRHFAPHFDENAFDATE